MDSEQRGTTSVQAELMFLITDVAVLTINLYFSQAMQRTACVFPPSAERCCAGVRV